MTLFCRDEMIRFCREAMIGLNREAVAADSRGRQPADRSHDETLSREAAAARDCCRGDAAQCEGNAWVCGLTPAAKWCRGYAPDNNSVIAFALAQGAAGGTTGGGTSRKPSGVGKLNVKPAIPEARV